MLRKKPKWVDPKGKKLPMLKGEDLPNVRFIKLNKSQYGKKIMGYNYYDRKYQVPLVGKPKLKKNEFILDGKKITK